MLRSDYCKKILFHDHCSDFLGFDWHCLQRFVLSRYTKHWKSYVSFQLTGQTESLLVVIDTNLWTSLLFMNAQMRCVMSNFLFLKNYHCKENTGIVFSCHEPMQYGISYYVLMRSWRYKLNICGVLSPDGLWQCDFSILVVGQNWNHISHT